MTNYGRDSLESLWQEILELHWSYLEMEESLKKIEERKKLEGRLREYISIVPHDRKFFLPETEHVLRASILHMKDFSAYKSAIGFESISQYANNLFMKPWRKEYRVIKMYSGFYQHEIRNNLLDAEKIFIAMGYKLLPNQTLVLDGVICPDQITNVSRDALTAYVECQIMKQVNSELTKMGVQTTWTEIFNFRECHIGDSSQTIKGLSQIIQSQMHNMHMHNNMRKDPYASPHYQQQICSSLCNMHSYNNNSNINNQAIPPLPPPPSQQNPYYHHYAQPCSLHSQNTYATPIMPPAPLSSSTSPSISSNCFQQQQQLPHSKSLDQYDASGNKMHSQNGVNNYHHRLSLDSHSYKSNHLAQMQPPPHPQQSFDFIDSAFNHHPYNQPNVRAPLPFNLSSNLGSHFSSSTASTIPEQQHDYYSSINDHQHMNYYQQPMMMQQLPTPVSEYCQQHSPSLISQPTPPAEVKLRSSLKKSTTHSTSDSLEMDNITLNELRALKREKSSTPASTSSEMKSRDGIGNYQAWDYVFQNLEKDIEKKKTITADEKIAAELENLKITANGHGPPRDHHRHHSKSVNSSNKHNNTNNINNMTSQTKARTKSVSVSTSTDLQLLHNAHEHKRTSSVSNESNHKIQMPKPPELIVGEDEWSCRFCTFLNPNSKKICEMCSKSKDFFSDATSSNAATAGKSSSASTATCV